MRLRPSARAWTPRSSAATANIASDWSRAAWPASARWETAQSPWSRRSTDAALAGGFALSLLCDLRLAAEEASFGFPELPRGIPPSYASARAALPAPVAAELTLTGRLLDAAGAERMGIVGAVYPADELMPRAIELAGRIASGPRQAIAETKRRILLDRERTIGHLFDEEERLLRKHCCGRPRCRGVDGPACA